MWRIVKQSDRETMVDELNRLRPLTEGSDNEQRQRAVAFTVAELQAGNQDNCSINLSGSRTNGDNYLSIVIGAKPRELGWVLNKANLPNGLTRQQLITYLIGLPSGNEQQARAVGFAVAELQGSAETYGSINMGGHLDSGFIGLSVSTAN